MVEEATLKLKTYTVLVMDKEYIVEAKNAHYSHKEGARLWNKEHNTNYPIGFLNPRHLCHVDNRVKFHYTNEVPSLLAIEAERRRVQEDFIDPEEEVAPDTPKDRTLRRRHD